MYLPSKLSNNSNLIKIYQEFVKSHFKNGDYALTLTFKPSDMQYHSKYKPDLFYFSEHIAHYLNVVNYKFLGRDFKCRGHRLKVVNTFELNGSQGVHCHMILENPIKTRIKPCTHLNEILNCWLKTKCSGYSEANKIVATYDANGWIDYIFKDANKNNTDFIDYHNWFFPH